MRQFNLLLLSVTMLTSISGNAQLNYLFSATTRPYVPVTGGINPHLTTNGANHELADEGLATIPIGFTFKYDGNNYSHANVNVNGFITLGLPPEGYWLYWITDIKRAPYGIPYQRPVIAPLWDDLYLVDTLNLVYKTTGHYPFRVFTIEWKKAKWSYDALTPVLSIELKLYETTNIIEFHYKDEGGIPDQFAHASIGITSSNINRDFISLQSTSAHPGISMLKPMDFLKQKPANNQVYRFVPAILKAPANFRRTYGYTDKAVSLRLHSGEFNAYEYAVTRSPIAPSSGTATFLPNVTISSLSPATTYYLYTRSRLFGLLYSQWACDSFKTSVSAVSIPYQILIDPLNSFTTLPEDVRTQDFQDTSIYYQGDAWFAFNDFPNVGDNGFYPEMNGYYNLDTWLFTRGISLIAGKTYALKFSYFAFYRNNPGEFASFEIKYGKGIGAGGMTAGTLFKKTNIDNYDTPADTTIEFSPDRSGDYYFGIHDLTLSDGALPIIFNISFSEKTSLLEQPMVLNGKTYNNSNVLDWTLNNKQNNSGFEVQRSTDGLSFAKIGEINPATTAKITIDKIHGLFKTRGYSEAINFATGGESSSKRMDKSNAATNKTGFGTQRSVERVSLAKVITSNPGLNNETDLQTVHNYIDNNARGVYYYRLQQAGKDGKLKHSNIIKLKSIANVHVANVYPNPAKDVLNIEIEDVDIDKMIMVVFDAFGKVVISKAVKVFSKGTNHIQLAISGLPAGHYTLKLVCNNGCGNAVAKFVKQ